MPITIPSPTAVSKLGLAEPKQQVAETLLDVLQAHPQNRILLLATIYVLHYLGASQQRTAALFGCTTRAVRYIDSEVKASQRGEGKAGRPVRSTVPTATAPRTLCYSVYAGLWLLLPLLLDSRLLSFCQYLHLATPVLAVVPWQWVLTMMALAWVGFSRPHYLNDLCDGGLALFTGRSTVLDASRAGKVMHAISTADGEAFYQASAQQEWREITLERPWLSSDEHTVGHQGGPEMPKSRVPRFGRVYAAHQLIGTFVLGARRFVGLVVGPAKLKLCHTAVDSLSEARTQQQRAQPSAQGLRAILDRGSYKGSTHQSLQFLKEQGVQYLALARRTKKNVAQWDALLSSKQLVLEPYTHHHDLVLPEAERRTNFALAVCQTQIKDCATPVPTVLIIDKDKCQDADPKAKYVAAFFGTLDLTPGLQAQVYPSRQQHELAYRDVIHALGFDALPKGYRKTQPDKHLDDPEQVTELDTKDIFLVSWLRFLAYNRVTQFLVHLPEAYQRMTVLTAARKFLCRPGLLSIHEGCLVVRLDPFPDSVALSDYLAWVNERRLPIPWLKGLILRIEIADRPAMAAVSLAQKRKLLSLPEQAAFSV
jgi:hypothetical protein